MKNATATPDIDLTKYNPTVTNYYIDPATRKCYDGKFCYNCLVPKFPGYEPVAGTDTDASIIKHSRGKLRIIEKSATQYGFSYVTNQKTEIELSSGLTRVTINHIPQGSSRQSFGNFYIQNKDLSVFDIYALHDVGGTLKFEKIYTTTEAVKAHVGYDRALWWPTKNFFLVRQYDRSTWDGYGLNALSVEVSQNPTNYKPEQLFEPFSTGPISIEGDIPFDAVFANDMMIIYRENTMDNQKLLTMYSWTPGHFRAEYEYTIVNANTATSFVSFGTDKGVLLWHNTEKTGKLYKPDGTAAVTISVVITDATKSAEWTALSNPDFRLIQARPSPANPEQAPPVYAYYKANEIFTVTLDLATSKITLNPLITLNSRFNLYQPVDIGKYHIANMVVHPCTVPTTDTDRYAQGSVIFYELGSADPQVYKCIPIASTETAFN